jgi:two-component system response regulator LytT
VKSRFVDEIFDQTLVAEDKPDELQTRLDPALFWRVHRSHLVNITKIKEIVPWFSRNYLLKMKDAKSTEIPVSRSQTRRLKEHLQL